MYSILPVVVIIVIINLLLNIHTCDAKSLVFYKLVKINDTFCRQLNVFFAPAHIHFFEDLALFCANNHHISKQVFRFHGNKGNIFNTRQKTKHWSMVGSLHSFKE